MAQNNATDDEPDLTNEVPALGTGGLAVSPKEAWFPNVKGGEWGIVTRKHSDRTERLDVSGWDIVEYDLDGLDGEKEREEFDTYREEIVDWLTDALRDNGKHFVGTAWEDTFRYKVTDGEGDDFTIELETDNHRVLSR